MQLEHHFLVEDAEKYGVEKAVLLYNIRFWLDKNKANKTNVFEHTDGITYFWTFNSSAAFCKLFPYMSAKKIARLLRDLAAEGAIINGNFNNHNYDRTKWYTMPKYSLSKNEQCIAQKWTMECSKMDNALSKNEQPIPDINTDRETHISAGCNPAEDNSFVPVVVKKVSPDRKPRAMSTIDKIIEVFYAVNPTIGWSHLSNRRACQELIGLYGDEKAIELAKQVVSVQNLPYAPVAVTPYQMKHKLAQFEIFFQRARQEAPIIAT